MAKLLAYAECSVQVVLANTDPRFCDCTRIIDTADLPVGNQPDKQRELSLKADWKYTAAEYFAVNCLSASILPKKYPVHLAYEATQYAAGIFQPPRA